MKPTAASLPNTISASAINTSSIGSYSTISGLAYSTSAWLQRSAHQCLARSKKREYYAELLAQSRTLLIPGVKQAITAASRFGRMGIVTSSRRDHFEQTHQQLQTQGHDLLRHFDFVVAEGDYRAIANPRPILISLVLNKLVSRPTNALLSKILPRGLRAALAAGLRCIVIRNAFFCREYDFPGASHVIEQHHDLPELLSQLFASSNNAI